MNLCFKPSLFEDFGIALVDFTPTDKLQEKQDIAAAIEVRRKKADQERARKVAAKEAAEREKAAQAKAAADNEEAQETQPGRKVQESYTWGHTKIPAGAHRLPSGTASSMKMENILEVFGEWQSTDSDTE